MSCRIYIWKVRVYMSLKKSDVIFLPESKILAENEFLLSPVTEEMALALDIMMYNGALRLSEHIKRMPGVSKKVTQEMDKYLKEIYG